MINKHITIAILMSFLATTCVAGNASEITQQKADDTGQINMLVPLQPTYVTTYINPWRSNWFLEVKGGVTTFAGSPAGCGDIFDRITPALQVGFGKWFTPAIGGRLAFQGLQFKNADLQPMNYQYYHADFLYNLTSQFNMNEFGQSRFDVIPFVGMGIIRNTTKSPYAEGVGNHPFAFNYGIQLRLLLTSRLHLVGEISGLTTMRNFDCIGSDSKLGDNMISVSLGLSLTIGKKGWAKVIDAKPYIAQNNYLLDQYALLETYKREHQRQTDSITAKSKNDYSGLNSLRYRMSISKENEEFNQEESQCDTTQLITVNVPIYFYFQLNTNTLVDNSQLANLDEIARIAKEQNLTVNISGAADSATGTQDTNRNLATARAKYIAQELIKRGVAKDSIKAVSLGGISQFTPNEANRFTAVILSQ